MPRYRSRSAGAGERVVHNFPADGRTFGMNGFRYWTENVAEVDADRSQRERVRCYCDWTETAAEHYSTVRWVTEDDERRHA